MARRVMMILLALSLLLSGSLVGCEEEKEEGIKEGSAEWHMAQGWEWANQDEYTLAIREYTKAIEIEPKSAIAYYQRGIVYRYDGKPDLAIADYTKAIELEPDSALLHSDRAVAYVEIEEYQLALADCNKAIELDPEFATSYGNKASVYKNMGENAKAIENLEKFIELTDNEQWKASARQQIEELSAGMIE